MARGRTLNLKVETEVKGLDKLDKLGGKLSKLGADLTRNYTLPLVAAGAAAVKFASDAEEATSKAAQVFTTQSDRIIRASENMDDAFSRATFLDTAGTFGALLQNMGLVESEAADLSLAWLDLAQDMASFHNTNPEEALNAIRSALAGEFEPLKRFGVQLNAALIETRALEQGLWDGTGAIDAQTRALIINQELFAQQPKVLGDYERTADGVANSTKNLVANFEDAAAELGKELLPLAAELLTIINEWVKGFASLDPEIKTWVIRIAAVTAAVGPALLVVGKLVSAYAALVKLAPAVGLAWPKLIPPVAVGLALGELRDKASEVFNPDGPTFGEMFAASIGAGHDEVEANLEQYTGQLEGWGDRSVRTLEQVATDQADALGGMPEKAADELLANQYHLDDAIAELLNFMDVALTPAEEVFNARMFLASQAAADGIASNNPLVKTKTEEMIAEARAVIDAFGLEAFNYGFNFSGEYAAGIVNNLGVVHDAGRQLAAKIGNQARIESEPPDHTSPLYGITKWGENLARTYAAGIIGGLGSVSDAATRMAGAVAQPTIASPRPSRSAGVLGGIVGGHVTNINLTFTGEPPDSRDERELVATLQRLAPFIDGRMAAGY